MKFIIDENVFAAIPDLYIGVVVAKGIDNTGDYPAIHAMLEDAIAAASKKFEGAKVKEHADILPYREAFRALGINPNKFMCSIEALFTRIAKGKGMPFINPLVDLNNAVSLSHTLPMGTHDLGISSDDVCLRFSSDEDSFIAFGSTEPEAVDKNELVYAVGNQVRTRRWTWRQSEAGKIDGTTNYVFFPIDGFVGFNDAEVKIAAEELKTAVETIFGAEASVAFLDKNNKACEL